jgi:hypothetical protein
MAFVSLAVMITEKDTESVVTCSKRRETAIITLLGFCEGYWVGVLNLNPNGTRLLNEMADACKHICSTTSTVIFICD